MPNTDHSTRTVCQVVDNENRDFPTLHIPETEPDSSRDPPMMDHLMFHPTP